MHNLSFKQKYLKYKKKYLTLKNVNIDNIQKGGVIPNPNLNLNPKIKFFIQTSQGKKIYQFGINTTVYNVINHLKKEISPNIIMLINNGIRLDNNMTLKDAEVNLSEQLFAIESAKVPH